MVCADALRPMSIKARTLKDFILEDGSMVEIKMLK